MLLGLSATILGVLAGGFIGLVAGAIGGVVDSVIMRLLDGLLAVPDLLFTLLIVTVPAGGPGHPLPPLAVPLTPGLAPISRSPRPPVRTPAFPLPPQPPPAHPPPSFHP